MKWLLWREYRLNRLILMAGAVLLLAPYVVGLIVLCWAICWAKEPPVIEGLPYAVVVFGAAALYSILLSLFTVALLGGNAIAGERADRSAEFMAYLPVSRGRRLASKLSLTLLATASIWAVNLLVLGALVSLTPEMRWSGLSQHASSLAYWALTSLLIYCVSWLFSSLQSNPSVAICTGAVSPLFVVMGLQAAAWIWSMPITSRFLPIGYPIASLLLAVASFAAGSVYYLRRVEP